jgi:uncharacterized protein YqgC (DUF456 family)
MKTLVIFAIIVIIVSVLDYVVPIWGTKSTGVRQAESEGVPWG